MRVNVDRIPGYDIELSQFGTIFIANAPGTQCGVLSDGVIHTGSTTLGKTPPISCRVLICRMHHSVIIRERPHTSKYIVPRSLLAFTLSIWFSSCLG